MDNLNQLKTLIANLEPDAVEVMHEMAIRLTHGQQRYGKIDIDTDQRDFQREKYEEDIDAAAYACISYIKRKRLMAGLRPRVYIAGPYSAPTPAGIKQNINNAEAAAVLLMMDGFAPFTPHLNTAGFEGYDCLEYEWFMATDLAWLPFADVVYFLSNWADSPGAVREMQRAKELGIPVVIEGEDGEAARLERIMEGRR